MTPVRAQDRLDDLAQDDPSHFPARELEHWYFHGGVNGSAKVQGRVLNMILRTSRFMALDWYCLTAEGIVPWAD
jgi:hypothetical protein